MKLILSLISVTAMAIAANAAHPCKADMDKFCKDVKPGGGAIAKCMKEHAADLSAECKASSQEMKGHMKDAKDACAADIQKFCETTHPGGGRIIQCLKQHSSDVSQGCKDSIEKMRR